MTTDPEGAPDAPGAALIEPLATGPPATEPLAAAEPLAAGPLAAGPLAAGPTALTEPPGAAPELVAPGLPTGAPAELAAATTEPEALAEFAFAATDPEAFAEFALGAAELFFGLACGEAVLCFSEAVFLGEADTELLLGTACDENLPPFELAAGALPSSELLAAGLTPFDLDVGEGVPITSRVEWSACVS